MQYKIIISHGDECNLSLVLKQYLYAKNKMTFYKQKVVHFLNGPGCEGQT